MKPRLVFCDRQGRMYDHPRLLAAGFDGPDAVVLPAGDLIQAPRGSDFMMLPDRAPIGIDPRSGGTEVLSEWKGKPVCAAAVFMAPAHTQSHRAAYVTAEEAATLPLFAYTALAWAKGRFYAAGVRVDGDRRQDPWRFDMARIERRVDTVVAGLGQNRVAQQLKKCALEYHCRAAQNFFLSRHEAPLPTSVACNSRCVGCLSLQKDGEFRAAHDRLDVPPTPEEIAEVALRHLDSVGGGVVSFGQGCEGEPLINGHTLERAIGLIRRTNTDGTVNLNTNGSRPDIVARLIDAGLDSIRVSINSFRKPLYDSYYRPAGYSFDDVLTTIKFCRKRGVFVSVNLLYFPGVTDTTAELNAIWSVMDADGLDLIQMRNLNIDPELYIRSLPDKSLENGIGVREFMTTLRDKFPHLRFGYFNPAKETYKKFNLP